ncbi:MAG: transporter [Pedosphaera sp.]|nr:transporter [Pedosphaera sp.]
MKRRLLGNWGSIEHPTSNIQHRMAAGTSQSVLECGSPLPLLNETPSLRTAGEFTTRNHLGQILFLTLIVFVTCVAAAHAAESNIVTLPECFQKVLTHDEQLLRLRKDIERAAGTRLEFHSRDLPHLSVEPTVGLRGGKLYVHNSPYALVTAEFSQPLFNMGMAANWRRGNLELVATEQNLNAAAANRLYDVRILYLRAQRLRQIISLYEEIDRRLQANVTSEQQRREAGQAGPRPELQARVQLLAERAELTEFRREDEEVRTDLAETMGDPMDRLPQPAGPLQREAITLDLKAQAQLAEQRRADLKFLRTLIAMANEDRRVTQAGYFPYVSLIGSALYIPGRKRTYQVMPIIEGQQPFGTDIRGGVSLTWQIVDNGAVTGASRRIAGIRGEYEVILKQLEENVPRELGRVAHSLENAGAKLAALEKSTTEAEEGLRLIETRIGLGEATQLDFSDAQRNLLAVRHAVVDALFEHASALAELDRVTGRYLEFAEPVKEP